MAGSNDADMSGPIDGSDLELVSMGTDFLRAQLNGESAFGSGPRPVRLWKGWDESDYPATRVRLLQLETMPELGPWLMYAVVRRSDLQMVGQVGFHTAPGPAYLNAIAPSGIEIGYSIFPPFRTRGFAYVSVSALIQRAHDQNGVDDFIASISRENTPSQGVARRAGFEFLKEFEPGDPDREDMYLLRLEPTGP